MDFTTAPVWQLSDQGEPPSVQPLPVAKQTTCFSLFWGEALRRTSGEETANEKLMRGREWWSYYEHDSHHPVNGALITSGSRRLQTHRVIVSRLQEALPFILGRLSHFVRAPGFNCSSFPILCPALLVKTCTLGHSNYLKSECQQKKKDCLKQNK